MQPLCTAIGQPTGHHDLRAVEVVGENVLGDGERGVLAVAEPYVGEQRCSDLIVETGGEGGDEQKEEEEGKEEVEYK